MNFIEKHSKILAVALCICACGPVLSTVYAYEKQPGWHGEGADRYYILESNHEEATGLTEIDGNLYYFNGDGEMQFGWQSISDDTYYFSQDGTAVKGQVDIQGVTYNFKNECKLMNGWNAEGTSYYDDKGFMKSQEWIEDGGFKYYLDNSGTILTGWKEVDGKMYYFDEAGKMATGEVTLDGKTWYLQQDGTFNKGWVKKGSKYFYYLSNGKLVRNTDMEIDGDLYFFDENGTMLTNTTKDGYRIGASGKATKIVEVKKEEPKEEEERDTSSNNGNSNKPNHSNSNTGSNNNSSNTNSGYNNNNSYNGGYTQPSAPSYGVSGSSIAAAALAQVGVNQDCTALVSNSLAAVGINYHGWPEGYLSLGTLTSSPVPGDIIVYSGHVAIYIGNGQAVHGGWNGYTTVVTSVSCSNALIGYVHVG